jgi:hypothetical protein
MSVVMANGSIVFFEVLLHPFFEVLLHCANFSLSLSLSILLLPQ